MEIRTNVAENLKDLMRARGRSLAALSRQWDVPLSSMKVYLKGGASMRSDTIELLAGRAGVAPEALITRRPAGWERERMLLRAAGLFGELPEERRRVGADVFLRLTALFSAGHDLPPAS